MQLKPLILSVVHGLQLVGVQLRSAPAQVNQFWGPLFLSQLSCMQYGGFARCFDLAEVAAPPLDTVTARVISVTEEIFFFFWSIRQMTAPVEGLAQVRPG